MRCMNCGCENRDGLSVCEVCGAPLASVPPSAAAAASGAAVPPPKPADPSNKRKLAIGLLSTAIALVITVTTVVAVTAQRGNDRITAAGTTTAVTAEAPTDTPPTATTEDESTTEATTATTTAAETTTATTAAPTTTAAQTTAKQATTQKTTAATTAKGGKVTRSDWVLAENVPRGAKIVQEMWTYDQLEKKTAADKSPEKEGYVLYNTDWKWGSYGSWSSWSTKSVTASDSRQTETRTTYRFHAFVCSRCGSRDPYSTPCDYCGNSSVMVWEETYYPFKGTTRSYTDIGGKPRISYDGKYWYFEYNGQNNGEGGTGQPSRTEYRYRDRSKVYTYYYQKLAAKESNTPVTASATVSNVKHWVIYEIS